MKKYLQLLVKMYLVMTVSIFITGHVFAQYPAVPYHPNSIEPAFYPVPANPFVYSDWITNVTFAGINNNTSHVLWRNDYSGTTHGTVNRGETYTISVTVNAAGADFSYQHVDAYIDWNRNGDCGGIAPGHGGTGAIAAECYPIVAGAGHANPATLSITVPMDAAIGTTWLRVTLEADGSVDSDAYLSYFGFGEIEEYAIEVGAALPVELTTFTANTIENKVTLNWQTATEVNNYGFEIERSQNNNWEKIGFVEGHGNSNSPKDYSFSDKPTNGSDFKYRLKQVDFDGNFEFSPEIAVSLIVPQFSVKQNYPNPFNPSTKIEFSIPKSGNVKLSIFNAIGQEVAVLINENMEAGNHNFQFSSDNYQLSSGIYFYKVISGKYSETKKMILLR